MRKVLMVAVLAVCAASLAFIPDTAEAAWTPTVSETASLDLWTHEEFGLPASNKLVSMYCSINLDADGFVSSDCDSSCGGCVSGIVCSTTCQHYGQWICFCVYEVYYDGNCPYVRPVCSMQKRRPPDPLNFAVLPRPTGS